MPFVSPVTLTGDAAPVPVKPPGLDVTVYDVTAEPPLFAGAVNATFALALDPEAETAVGAPGTVAGMTAAEGSDTKLVPKPLVAVTVNVYDVPFVNPVTINGEAEPVFVKFPGLDVTV